MQSPGGSGWHHNSHTMVPSPLNGVAAASASVAHAARRQYPVSPSTHVGATAPSTHVGATAPSTHVGATAHPSAATARNHNHAFQSLDAESIHQAMQNRQMSGRHVHAPLGFVNEINSGLGSPLSGISHVCMCVYVCMCECGVRVLHAPLGCVKGMKSEIDSPLSSVIYIHAHTHTLSHTHT